MMKWEAEETISRQAAIRAYCENQCGKGMIRGECGCDDCGTIFDDIPSAQPEIIKCGNCLMHGVCRFEIGLGENGFCSQGKRGDEDENIN